MSKCRCEPILTYIPFTSDQLLTASNQQTDQLLTANDQQTDRIRLTANWIRKPEVSIEAVAVEMANAEEAAE